MIAWENDNRNFFRSGRIDCRKIKEVLAEDQKIECIPIADGREMTFGDVEIHTKQRWVFLKGEEVELTTRQLLEKTLWAITMA